MGRAGGLPGRRWAHHRCGFDPVDIAERHGADALRWWVLRELSTGDDTDLTVERLVRRANEELANSVGNLVNRVVGMVHRYREGIVPERVSHTRTDAAEETARGGGEGADRVRLPRGDGGRTGAQRVRQPSPGADPALGSRQGEAQDPRLAAPERAGRYRCDAASSPSWP
ncbi:class I tRNA ligase family protein [Streptomyces mirabilis]|uniref:class I tRNA ligase family protein n=1 Tax=Streptomyces mirabilis TaxID=68239 RepID=UPI00365B05DD